MQVEVSTRPQRMRGMRWMTVHRSDHFRLLLHHLEMHQNFARALFVTGQLVAVQITRHMSSGFMKPLETSVGVHKTSLPDAKWHVRHCIHVFTFQSAVQSANGFL